jgi:hypothetical protein
MQSIENNYTLPSLVSWMTPTANISLAQAPNTYTVVFTKTFGTLDSEIEVLHWHFQVCKAQTTIAPANTRLI